MHTPSTRVTSQQQSAYRIVVDSSRHMTADQVHTTASKTQPRLSRATVYRNLDKLAAGGMLLKTVIEGVGYYEKPAEVHYHAVCLLCHNITNIYSPRASDIEDHFARNTNYKLIKHELVLYGLCPACQE